MAFRSVGVIGLGYVGLPLALAVARSKKYALVPFDIDREKVGQIRDGTLTSTDAAVRKLLKKGALSATSDERLLDGLDVYLICVSTPIHDDFTPDYTPVISASTLIGRHMKKGATVVLESTVNPGTCEEVMIPVLEKASGLKAGRDFNVGMCPERINPGDPTWTIFNIPRNVGSLVQKKLPDLVAFYRSIIDAEILGVSCLKVAEATKIVENTFRDVNIAFVNELARSFDSLGIDLVETLRGAASKPFGFMPFWPGRGVGGHCIAVDPYYLIRRAAKDGFNHRFLKVARDVNNSMPYYTVRRLQDALNEAMLPVKGTTVALLGLSYKENVGDVRESPCLKVLKELERLGANVRTFDPYVVDQGTSVSVDDALSGAQAVMVCTAHKEFAGVVDLLKNSKTVKVFVDGMNKYDKEAVVRMGIIYRGIGR